MGAPAWLLAAFCLWFFRDPERVIPDTPGAIVSPGDGKVTDIASVSVDGMERLRVSIFLNVFNVHVNRSPIGGVIRDVRYRKGKFLNAMNSTSADDNEQNIVTVEGEGHTVIFKQIAGLIARRLFSQEGRRSGCPWRARRHDRPASFDVLLSSSRPSGPT